MFPCNAQASTKLLFTFAVSSMKFYLLTLMLSVVFASLGAQNLHAELVLARPSTDNDATDEEVDELISKLGSNEFAEREYAAKRLVEIGMPGVEKLRELKTAADSEVRFAATRIVKQIVREDFENRIDAFLAASENDDRDFGLPGWDVYSSQVGTSKNARELFAGMQRAHPRLMLSLDSDVSSINAELRGLMSELVSNANRYSDTPVESYAACFMLATAGEIKGEKIELPHNADNSLATLFRNQVVANQLREGKYNEILKKFLVRWIEKESTSISEDYYRLNIADTHGLTEAVPLALKMMADRDSPQHYYRQYAIWYLVKNTGTKHRKQIEELLDDKNVLRETKKPINGEDVEFIVQLRDVALASLVYMYKQPYEDFGFEMAPPNMTTPLSYSQAGFRDDQSRLKATKKWEAFKQKEDIK